MDTARSIGFVDNDEILTPQADLSSLGSRELVWTDDDIAAFEWVDIGHRLDEQPSCTNWFLEYGRAGRTAALPLNQATWVYGCARYLTVLR